MNLKKNTENPSQNTPNFSLPKEQLALMLLVFVGFLIRVWQLNYGLPLVYYHDEGLVVYFALNMGSGDLNPHHFYHPNHYYYLMFLLDVLYIFWGVLTGIFKNVSDAWKLYIADPTIFYVLGRFISALAGTASIYLIYRSCKQLFENKKIAFFSAFFLCFSWLHIQWSQLAYMDAPLTFYVFLSYGFAIQVLKRNDLGSYLLCGITAGLAASTKYQGILAFIWGPLACYLSQPSLRFPKPSLIADKRIVLFFILFCVGFIIGTPFSILAWREFTHDFLGSWTVFKPGGIGEMWGSEEPVWLFYLKGPLVYAFGIPLLLASFFGFFSMFQSRNRQILLFLSFPLLYAIVACLSSLGKSSYILPLIPFFCISAGYGVNIFLERVGNIVGRSPFRLNFITVLVLVVLIIPNLFRIYHYNRIKLLPDTRVLAHDWILKNWVPHEKVLTSQFTQLVFPETDNIKRFDASVFDTRLDNKSSLKTLKEYRAEGYTYLLLDEWHKGAILHAGIYNPRYMSTTKRYEEFFRQLDSQCQIVAIFSPYKGANGFYDRENIHLPSRGLENLKNLGPALWLYKL